MAKCVGVCRASDHHFERRQLPLVVDDALTLVVEFEDSCLGCGHLGVKQNDLEKFVQRYYALSSDEVTVALMVTSKNVFNMLANLIPCVGCRRSCEEMFLKLASNGYPALEPLIVTKDTVLSLKRECLFDPKALFALFYIHGKELNSVIEALPKNRKTKRCMLHSLDVHKARSTGSWKEAWNSLSKECKEEVTIVEYASLSKTVETYIQKHRFCSECKNKVVKAYNILIGEHDHTKEKDYRQSLYDGLQCCKKEKHIHMRHDDAYIDKLLEHVESEMANGQRERHAKTLDVAQEEVLTCLAIHIHERLYKIFVKLGAEEQTWQILFYVGIAALKRSFEAALEQKQGISNLELVCKELLELEQAQEQKREQKRRRKKRNKKNKSKADEDSGKVDDEDEEEEEENKENYKEKPCLPSHVKSELCTSKVDVPVPNGRCRVGGEAVPVPALHGCSTLLPVDECQADCCLETCDRMSVRPQECLCSGSVVGGGLADSVHSSRSDCGYSSDHECYDSSCHANGVTSVHGPADSGCSGHVTLHTNHCGDGNDVCESSSYSQPRDRSMRNTSPIHRACCGVSKKEAATNGTDKDCSRRSEKALKSCQLFTTLEDMLEDSCSSGEGDDVISEEDIQKFRANQRVLDTQRQELRATLKQRFEDLQRRCLCTDCHEKLRVEFIINDAATDDTLCSRTAKLKLK